MTPVLTRTCSLPVLPASTCTSSRGKVDTDIQATLTEVRPDGKETHVQNGWLRASHRAINKKASTAC